MSDIFVIFFLAIIILLAIIIGLMLGQNKRWTLRDIWDVITIVLLLAFIILLPIGAGAALFFWFGPIGFWQILAAFILICIVVPVLYFLEFMIIAIFA